MKSPKRNRETSRNKQSSLPLTPVSSGRPKPSITSDNSRKRPRQDTGDDENSAGVPESETQTELNALEDVSVYPSSPSAERLLQHYKLCRYGTHLYNETLAAQHRCEDAIKARDNYSNALASAQLELAEVKAELVRTNEALTLEARRTATYAGIIERREKLLEDAHAKVQSFGGEFKAAFQYTSFTQRQSAKKRM